MGLVCAKTVNAVLCTASETLAEQLEIMLKRWSRSESVPGATRADSSSSPGTRAGRSTPTAGIPTLS